MVCENCFIFALLFSFSRRGVTYFTDIISTAPIDDSNLYFTVFADMYKHGGSSSIGDTIVGDGGLIWGYEENLSPDQIIQSSFIEEMGTVSEEVKDLLKTLKSKEFDLREREKLLSKQQLKLDIQEKGVADLQRRVTWEMERLEKGTFQTVVTLESSISELKKENQRLKESFQIISKHTNTIKSEMELVQSRNSKLEKQLTSANGRIKNLIKLQDCKPKEITVQEKVDVKIPKKEANKKTKPSVQKDSNKNQELTVLLMKALSNIDKEHFTKLFEEAFQHHFSGLLASLTTYLKQVSTNSAVLQYPGLKLALKCISVMNESELSTPSVKMVFRKLSDVLCSEQQYSNSPHLHSRIISSLILTKTSLQVNIINYINC